MNTLDINVEAIVFESVAKTGAIAKGTAEYRSIEYVPSRYTATDNLLKVAHALLVDSGTILKRQFVDLAVASVEDGVFQIRRAIEGGDIVMVSAPIVNGELHTTKIAVGNHQIGEVNLFKEVARSPIKNGVRLTKMYSALERAFKEYEKTLRQSSLRKLMNQIEIVEGLLAKH